MASRTTVYVVDDDPLVTESLGTALRLETPYEVRVFQSGPAALAALADAPPDVVITDFKMPGMDGLQLLRAVRQACPNAVLMLLTGYADKESAIQAINEVGIFQYVEKPWDLQDLLLKIKAGVERVELVKRLVDSERMAAVGRLAAAIAHEIGNQLALVGYAEAIKARSQATPEIAEFADVIVAAQKRLLSMVGEIKDFAARDADAAERPELEPADVAAVVDDALAILRYDRDVAARTLVRDTRRRPLARLHRGKFAQVVINLVRNAAQATPAKGRIQVSLDEDPATGEIALEIADDGGGMSADVLRRLGEPFFTTRERGTGLGVGISRRIVEEHGGRLAYESAPGKGTRARITLPALTA